MRVRGLAVAALSAIVVLAGLLAVNPPAALAQNEDPAVLQISSTGQYCQSGGACVVGNEANPLSPTMLSILDNQGGSPNLDKPVLLIVGIPNGTIGQSLPTVTIEGGGTATLGGSDYYHGDWATGGADQGFAPTLFTSGNTYSDVYAFLGMTQGNASQNFGNWASADTSPTVGLASVDAYAIAVFELFPSTPLGAKGLLDITFSSGLGVGDVVIAYGCSKVGIGDNYCAAKENPYTTPFTQAGVVTPAAEPSAVALLGIVLLAFAAVVGSARRKQVA
jgi:hypothetical protein